MVCAVEGVEDEEGDVRADILYSANHRHGTSMESERFRMKSGVLFYHHL